MSSPQGLDTGNYVLHLLEVPGDNISPFRTTSITSAFNIRLTSPSNSNAPPDKAILSKGLPPCKRVIDPSSLGSRTLSQGS